MLLIVPLAAHASHQPAQTVQQLGTIVVTGTPLPVAGLGLSLSRVPTEVQTIDSHQIASQADANLPALLQRNLGGVSISNAQDNPFQPDVSFHGFDASPLLGTPEALSVYIDGVRINEPFGDVVNFDLVPLPAIARVTLISGSNPVYGLNTLGGALSFQTKSGFDYPGLGAAAYAGSFDTRRASLQDGGHNRHFGYYFAANRYASDGWAAHNPSSIKQFFAKGSYHNGGTSLDLSVTGADNHLGGNQTLPLSFLGVPDQAYTFPDYFDNRLAFLVLDAQHRFDDHLALAGNLYNRVLDTGGFDSDVSDAFNPSSPINTGNSPSVNDLDRTHEHSHGGTLQLIDTETLAGHANHFVIGASADLGDTDFAQDQQPAIFSAQRESIGIAAAVPRTRLGAHNAYYGVYATDTWSLAPALALTLSGRYNHTHIELDDRLGDALNGTHDFARFNPAIGVAWHPNPRLTMWVDYDEGTRTPSPSELTCADPNAPCSLPNNFVSDPALREVVAHSWQAGVRGRIADSFNWNASIYRTDLDDDLLFVSLTGLKGFYRNVPGDRRQGVDLGISGALGHLQVSAHYDYVDATYRSAFTEASPSNSSADAAGLIAVVPGDRMPGIPRQRFKLSLRQSFTPRFEIRADLIAVSSRYAFGDENNADLNGPVPGHAVVDLAAHYRFGAAWDFFASVDNLFDHRYFSDGQLGENLFADPAQAFDPQHPVATQFRAVSAPRTLLVGFRHALH